MTSETKHTETTTLRMFGGSLYARLPPSFIKYLELEQKNQEATIGMADGKHGKFLWIQKEVKE